jgi:hypothetical protein
MHVIAYEDVIACEARSKKAGELEILKQRFVFVYICIHITVEICGFIHTHTHTHVRRGFVSVYICIHITVHEDERSFEAEFCFVCISKTQNAYIHAYVYAHMYTKYVHIYIYIYIYIHIQGYIHTHTHTHTHNRRVDAIGVDEVLEKVALQRDAQVRTNVPVMDDIVTAVARKMYDAGLKDSIKCRYAMCMFMHVYVYACMYDAGLYASMYCMCMCLCMHV